MFSANRGFALLCFCLVAVGNAVPVVSAEPKDLLKTLRQVNREGKGNARAQGALLELTRSNASVLPALLESMTGSNPLASNWLRNAFEVIAERELKQGGPLPAREFEAFVVDRTQDPGARRLAFEWLAKVDRTASQRLIPSMLDDPSPEFRRDAVQHWMSVAGDFKSRNQTDETTDAYRNALRGAVDDDQVQFIVSQLAELGIKVNVQKHFGFLANWRLVGPFDNSGEKGFDVPYPPEHGVDFKDQYQGRSGMVQWFTHTTSDNYGIVDLAKVISPAHGSCAYAACDFESAAERPVEFRLGTPNAWKLWLNGELMFGRDEYHRGMALDQYRVSSKLRRGTNRLLLKVCQNEQTQDWAQRWQFQIRMCDSSGAAILPPEAETSSRRGSSPLKSTLVEEGIGR